MSMSSQTSQAAAAAQFNLLHQQRPLLHLRQALPQQRSQLQQQFQTQNLPIRSPVKPVYEPGTCAGDSHFICIGSSIDEKTTISSSGESSLLSFLLQMVRSGVLICVEAAYKQPACFLSLVRLAPLPRNTRLPLKMHLRICLFLICKVPVIYMKDFIDYSQLTGAGPVQSLALFPWRTSSSSGSQEQNQPPEQQQQQQAQATSSPFQSPTSSSSNKSSANFTYCLCHDHRMSSANSLASLPVQRSTLSCDRGSEIGRSTVINGLTVAMGNNHVPLNVRRLFQSVARDQSMSDQQQHLENQLFGLVLLMASVIYSLIGCHLHGEVIYPMVFNVTVLRKTARALWETYMKHVPMVSRFDALSMVTS
ncbi:hypothetical protein Nepgr_033499 [Nepenthes gracilis]|uniref:Uncharacterized protein n=1 Tax=Nepenthes gracilis TaxID=150966 RepID=A0AAD3TKJ9_NEPGR|nr:hypothetical protein Nepgr_033499 [Nepenthes gracilis]